MDVTGFIGCPWSRLPSLAGSVRLMALMGTFALFTNFAFVIVSWMIAIFGMQSYLMTQSGGMWVRHMMRNSCAAPHHISLTWNGDSFRGGSLLSCR